jgi:CheY-like chemotaxis protein
VQGGGTLVPAQPPDPVRTLEQAEALSFPSAEELLQNKKLDENSCIIIDIRMPGLTGLDLQRELKVQGSRIPVLSSRPAMTLWSGNRRGELGAVAFFRKPIDDQALLDAISWAVSPTKVKNEMLEVPGRNSRGYELCGGCGAKLELVCPSCNFPNPLQFKFCGKCGHPLSLPAKQNAKELSFDEKLEKIPMVHFVTDWDLRKRGPQFPYTYSVGMIPADFVTELLSWCIKNYPAKSLKMVGLKDSSGNLAYTMEILEYAGDRIVDFRTVQNRKVILPPANRIFSFGSNVEVCP